MTAAPFGRTVRRTPPLDEAMMSARRALRQAHSRGESVTELEDLIDAVRVVDIQLSRLGIDMLGDYRLPMPYHPDDRGNRCEWMTCIHREEWEAVRSHTRTLVDTERSRTLWFCAECSAAVGEWVSWPCIRMRMVPEGDCTQEQECQSPAHLDGCPEK